jgi:hypothetical protein
MAKGAWLRPPELRLLKPWTEEFWFTQLDGASQYFQAYRYLRPGNSESHDFNRRSPRAILSRE